MGQFRDWPRVQGEFRIWSLRASRKRRYTPVVNESRRSAVHEVLGAAFHTLPTEVRDAHDSLGGVLVVGKADAQVGPGLLAWLICVIVGLPRSGMGQGVSVSLRTGDDGVDSWQRNFGGRRYQSRLEAGNGTDRGKLVEHQGRMVNVFSLEASAERLSFTLVAFRWMGLALPLWLAPRCQAFETGRDGKFCFDITITLPLIGHLISYRGTTTARRADT